MKCGGRVGMIGVTVSGCSVGGTVGVSSLMEV